MKDINYKEELPNFDLALSFAGEDRELVERIAKKLIDKGIIVFYDNLFIDFLLGKELITTLRYIYGQKSRFCAIFISEHYSKKVWTNKVEKEAILAKSINSEVDFILPIVIDNSWVCGIPETTFYIDLRKYSEDSIVEIIAKKICPKPIAKTSEEELFMKLASDLEIVGFMFQFDEKDSIHYWNFGYNKRISELQCLGSLLGSYEFVGVKYEHYGIENWIDIELTEKGCRFKQFLKK